MKDGDVSLPWARLSPAANVTEAAGLVASTCSHMQAMMCQQLAGELINSERRSVFVLSGRQNHLFLKSAG